MTRGLSSPFVALREDRIQRFLEARIALQPARRHGKELAIYLAAAPFSVFALLQHQKRGTRTGDDATARHVPALPDRHMRAAMQVAAELKAEQHIGVFGLIGAADQHMRCLAGTDAGKGGIDGRNTGALLAHEGA